MFGKCTIHNINDTSDNLIIKNINHGDIVIKQNNNDNYICLVYKVNGRYKLIPVLDLRQNSIPTINVPVIISKYIKDPLDFYSMMIDMRVTPIVCSISEIYLDIVSHCELINKYFNHYNKKFRFTLAYPMIYKISTNNCYNMTCRTIVAYDVRCRERTLT